MKELVIEVCANGMPSAMAAQTAGANRIELCEHLELDGLTPSHKIIVNARKEIKIPIHVLIRPRGGNFIYSKEEFEEMKESIRICKLKEIDGVVFGILNEEGSVDLKRCVELLDLTKPMSCTFHRAFDILKKPLESLEEIISLGFDRILTSGQKQNCLEGSKLIARLVKQAMGKISIVAGGGIAENNIEDVVNKTETNEFHFSAKVKHQSGEWVSNENRIRKIKELATHAYKSMP